MADSLHSGLHSEQVQYNHFLGRQLNIYFLVRVLELLSQALYSPNACEHFWFILGFQKKNTNKKHSNLILRYHETNLYKMFLLQSAHWDERKKHA